MPLFRAKFPTAHHFTVSLFGCQYHAAAPSPDKLRLIDAFGRLLRGSAALAVEELEQSGGGDAPTRVWMSHWASPQAFRAWWESPEVSAFWAALPHDGAPGFWRETVSLPATRAMYQGVAADQRDGFAHCAERIVPLTERIGYWGAYRSRLTKEEDEGTEGAGPGDPTMDGRQFASPLPAAPRPRPLGGQGGQVVRPGRVRMTTLPDNLCFVVEGQDYGAMGERERAHWDEHFDGLAKQWVTAVVTGGAERGLLSAWACHGLPSAAAGATKQQQQPGAAGSAGAADGAGDGDGGDVAGNGIFPGLEASTRQAQLLFWLDLSHMERMGKHDAGHVRLVRKFREGYGPGGAMEGGDLSLWVDLAVLKADEVDAEYVGCLDGTGFTAYDDHPLFASEVVAGATKLPAFYDAPIESKPEEW